MNIAEACPAKLARKRENRSVCKYLSIKSVPHLKVALRLLRSRENANEKAPAFTRAFSILKQPNLRVRWTRR
jgi:hypothetical protein